MHSLGKTLAVKRCYTIASTWKQPKYPSTDEDLKKMWHINAMEHCSTIKKNKFESVVVRGAIPELVIQSESQKEKSKHHTQC